MYKASIDIGSNSCLLLIARVSDQGVIDTVESDAIVTSLGKDLDLNKAFLEESMLATYTALKSYLGKINQYEILSKDVIVTATEASRVAKNSDQFFTKVKSELGLSVVKISGEGEAFYTAMGVLSGVETQESKITIMDIGGASTELITVDVNEKRIIDSVSLPVGSVRATDWIGLNEFEQKISDIFVDNLKKYHTDKIICVAGTMTTLSALILGQNIFDEKAIQGHSFSQNSLSTISNELSSLSSREILERFPLCGKRASSIFGGSVVATKLINFLNISTIEISTLGLRYGVIIMGGIDERFIEKR